MQPEYRNNDELERSRVSMTWVFNSPYGVITVANADGSNVAGSVYGITSQAWQCGSTKTSIPKARLPYTLLLPSHSRH